MPQILSEYDWTNHPNDRYGLMHLEVGVTVRYSRDEITSSLANFQHYIHRIARVRGLKAHTRTRGEHGGCIVQFYNPGDSDA